MFFSRKRPDHPSPSWVKWLIIGFIIYAIIAGQFRSTPENPSRIHQAWNKASHEISSNIPDADAYKGKLIPSISAALRIKDVEEGSGTHAICGQKIKIAYEAFYMDGKPVGDKVTRDKPLAAKLGTDRIMPALEEGVVGMRVGGKRSLMSPPNMAYGLEGYKREGISPSSSIRFEVELLAAEPKLPNPETTLFRMADLASGIGEPLACGQSTKMHLTVWNVDGKKLFSTKDEGHEPLAFTIGKSEVFLGLEQGVLGMQPQGARFLVIPPALQQTLDGSAPVVKIPFPKQQTVLVDVEALP